MAGSLLSHYSLGVLLPSFSPLARGQLFEGPTQQQLLPLVPVAALFPAGNDVSFFLWFVLAGPRGGICVCLPG